MPVGERGEALSGGQRQAVALARALVVDAPVLVFDEPTHALDQPGEERLKARLAAELEGRTLLLVTHRDSLLALVSHLIVMDAGRVVAHGPRDKVVRALAEGKVAAA
jgi:ATP-binding cassette subfamily C protein LapB